MAAFDLPINDTYLSASHHNSLEMPSPTRPSPGTSMPQSPPQPFDPDGLVDFLGTVPPVVTRLLVELSPALSVLRHILQILSWKSGRVSESWLFLVVYWIVCLGINFSLRYFMPIIILTPFLVSTLLQKFTKHAKQTSPATDAVLSRSLGDVNIIYLLLPKPVFSSFVLPWKSLARLLIALYFFYVIIVFTFSPSIIFGISGSLVITWRAHWAATIRNVLLSNGWVTYAARHAWHVIIGSPLPIELSRRDSIAKSSTTATAATSAFIPPGVPPASSLSFKFTIHENQRWWMGIDWTAALLPNERASWTSGSPTLRPLPPPMNISLPPTKAIYLPVPNDDAIRIKRTATWTWEESDWGVVVRLNTSSPPERVGMALPRITMNLPDGTPVSGISSAESLLQRGLQRVGSVSAELTGPTRTRKSSDAGEHTKEGSSKLHGDDDEAGVTDNGIIAEGPGAMVPRASPEEDVTDAEGWIYSDNKWEGSSGKGGIGKYTRYRRWTRIATLNEVVEIVSASEVHSIHVSRPKSPSKFSQNHSGKGSAPVNLKNPEPTTGPVSQELATLVIPSNTGQEMRPVSPTREKGGLRQRLQQAVSPSS